eukprot:m.93673 g.93673  ORF g.93673 m.93673 type:complete len:319 (-) comp12164_c0_seq1:61-1017(-)
MMLGRVAAAALSLVAAATALPAASTRPVRVLFIGNSYTFFNDLPHMFGNLSLQLRQPVEVDTEMVAPGGSSLFQHGNLSLPMGQATAAALAEPGGWDFVMLQDQSETPGGGCDTDSSLAPGEGFKLSSAALSSFFVPRLTQAHATPVLYSTWGRHDGDRPNAECCGYGTFLSMTARTTAGYRSYADTLTAGGLSPRIAPAGKAFEIVHNASSDPTGITSNFSCLYNHADAVLSSDLSAASTGVGGGVVRSGSGPNCTLDGAGLGGHPSILGTFLIAATMAGVVHGQRTASVEWAPEGVDPAHRSYLLQVADTAVFGAP